MAKSLTTRLRALPAAMKSWWGGAEGSWRGPFTGFGELGGSYMVDPIGDGWQRNLQIGNGDIEKFGPIYACIAIISQEMARIPMVHYRTQPDGSREVVTNKAPIRVLRNPNRYQTKSDFMLYMMRSLLLDGNAYAIATRNDRSEVETLHPVAPKQIWPYIVDGEIFYQFGDEQVTELANIDTRNWFPQRDVFHLKLFTPRHPLVGESPITAAYHPAVSGIEINRHTAAFFGNMSRPSGVLRHPGTIQSEDGIQRIKQKFMEITQRGHTGEPIVLQEGMTWAPLAMNAVDSQLVQSYELTSKQCAQCFRVPPFLLGDLEKSSFQNVESLSRFFINSTLGFYIDHTEAALVDFFGLPPNEEIHFDVEKALLRGDMESRMQSYSKGIQNAVLTPNEARHRENLPPMEYGDNLRAQQQLVPLSYGENLQPPGVDSAPEPEPEPEPEPTEEELAFSAYTAKQAIRKMMEA